MSLPSASMAQGSEELGFTLLNSGSANHDGIPGDCHHNQMTVPLPATSVSPFPSWDLNETSQCYGKQPAGVNSMIDSSEFKSAQNFQMDHQYSYKGEECKHLHRLNSDFPCPEGYVGRPYQYTGHDNLTIPRDATNAAFNVNSFDKPQSGAKCVIPSESLAGRPQMVNPLVTAMSGNIGHPLLNMNLNFGVPLPNENQSGAEPLLIPGKLDERFMTAGSGSNRDFKSNTNMPRINVTGNSQRIFLPPTPINTYHNHMSSRNFLYPGLGMNGAFSSFPNNSEVKSDLAQTGNHGVLFDSRPGLHLGSAAGDQNYYLRQVNRDLGLGGVQNIGMEFAGVGHGNGFERCMAFPPLPFVGSQSLPQDNGQSRVNGQLITPSIGMVTDQSPSGLVPEDNGKFSSQSYPSLPFVMTTGSTRGQDLSSNQGQSQVVGSIQQSNSALGPHSTSDLEIQAGKGHMITQVSRPSMMPSLKRAASQPLSSTVQGQRRKTLPTHPFIHPAIPTWPRLAPPVPNTPQAIRPLIGAAPPFTPQATHSSVPSFFPTTWTQSALSAPNSTQTVPPLMQTTSFLQSHDKRISSLHPSSHTPPLPNQQLISQPPAQQRLRTPFIPSAPNTVPVYIKYRDQTLEPVGYKCFLCKRDLSYSPEGPISQPLAPPAAAVLSCGHTFHEFCLERITPDDQSKDPPCIPCALRE